MARAFSLLFMGVGHKKAQDKPGLSASGAKETRTPDPLHAMQVVEFVRSLGPTRKSPGRNWSRTDQVSQSYDQSGLVGTESP